LALAKLVPHLRADAHSTAGALLVVNAGQAGSARGGKAVKTGEPLRLDEWPHGIELSLDGIELGGEFLLAEGDAGARFFVSRCQSFYLGAGTGQSRFQRFGAFKADKFLIFEAVRFGGLKLDFVLNGLGLGWSLYRVKLNAEAGGLLAVSGDVAIQPGAERFLAAEGG
jgi:hypothetical protein